jgi:hypothetical protein
MPIGNGGGLTTPALCQPYKPSQRARQVAGFQIGFCMTKVPEWDILAQKGARMGKEAEAQIRFAGQSGYGKILLETTEIILRGELRAKVPRDQILGFSVEGDDLRLSTAQGQIEATMGQAKAQAWVKALAKPLPSLADKLGIGVDRPVKVIGSLHDPLLLQAIGGCQSDQAHLFLAELSCQSDLDAALQSLEQQPNPVFWGITVKGKASPFPDAELRRQMRAAGYIDTKACAVSDRNTATRYGRKR